MADKVIDWDNLTPEDIAFLDAERELAREERKKRVIYVGWGNG